LRAQQVEEGCVAGVLHCNLVTRAGVGLKDPLDPVEGTADDAEALTVEAVRPQPLVRQACQL
jgi:hypothetical protein